MTAGRPPTRSLQILELWISIIDCNSDLQSDSKLNSNILKNRLINSNRYMQDRESYQQSIIRLNAALETGSEHGLFECENQVFWKLSREVITIIKSKKFKEERKNNFESAIRTIWETLRDNTWREYYNPKPISSIEIPTSLKNLLFHLPSSGKKPSWINPEGIHLEDVKAGYFPVKTLKALKIRVEEQWRKNKIVILVADPAQGKTTGVSILSYWWEKEAINNIIFKFEAKQWVEIQLEFERYLEEVTIFDRVIVVIENVHLTSQLDNIQKLNKKESVNIILTSRIYEERLKPFRNSDQYMIFPLPISYSKELLRLFLSHYGTAFTKNKKLIHGLLKDNVNQNILFLLTHTIEKIGKEEIFAWEKFISELEERLLSKEDSDKYYWMWILYSLSVMRYYELDFSKPILFEIIKLYDETLSRKYLGIAFTALEEQGIIHSLGYKENRYELVFHPNVAEKIKEYYSNEMKQMIGNLVEIEDKMLQVWLENKEVLGDKKYNFYPIEIETLIRRIGFERYNKLDLDIKLWKKRIPFIEGETYDYNVFQQKTRFIAINYRQQNLRKLKDNLLNESYFYQFLNFQLIEIDIPSVILKIQRDQIEKYILGSIDIKKVKLSKFFKEFKFKIDLGSSDAGGYLGTEYIGYRAFYYLSLNHPKFQEEVEKHIRNLYEQEKYKNYLETLFRIPRNVISKIDFHYVDTDLSFFEKIPFQVNNHMIEIEGDYFVQTTYELLELWNGPKLNELSLKLLNFVKERIKKNISFFKTEEDSYIICSKIEKWADNAEIRDQLKEIDLITEFDRGKFMEKKPCWILKRLEFFRKYNLELYNHVIKFKELKIKLTKIAKDYHDNIILKELEVRPSIYDLPRQNIEIEDIKNMKIDQLKRKIEKNPFHDWYNFLQKLQSKLKQNILEKEQKADKHLIQIRDLIEYLNSVRSKISKEEFISILKIRIAETPSYETKGIEELVCTFFKLYILNVSDLIDIGSTYEKRYNRGYRVNNPFWNLGYLKLETNEKQLFIEKLLKQELKIKCFKEFIKKNNDKEIFTKSLIKLLNEDRLNLLTLLSARSDVKNLFELLDLSQLELFFDYLLNIELEKSDLLFYFLVEIIRKIKEIDTIHKYISQLKRFNSIFLFKLYSNLSKQENYNFLRFLHEDWPVNNSFLKVCNQIGATKIANLLGKLLGILKSDEDEKVPKYYSRTGPFLIENNMSVDILTELLMKINFKSLNAGEENRILLIIFKYLKDNKKESLIKEFPLILMNVVNEKKILLFDLINPKEFNKLSHFNFEYLTNLISNFQQLQIEMRKEIENLVIIWNSDERSYNRLKTTQFIHIIESIWNWHDFSEETKKWDKNSREILFNYLIENLLELYKNIRCKIPASKINENKPVFHDLLSKISSIFEIDEKIRLIRLKLDEILFNEDLSVLIFFITLLKDEFEDLIEEIFEDYEIDEWMFYYSLQIQENDFTQEQDLRKISELVIILSEVKEKLSFCFDIWFSRIIKHAPKELIFLIFEQNKLEFSKEQITRISKLKDFQNWKLKDIFLLLLKSFNTVNFKNLWDEVEFFKRKKPTTSSELNYVLALLLIIKFSYKEKDIYEVLMLWLKSIESSISPLYSDFEEGYKMILEVYLGMDLKFNVSKNQLTIFSVLSYPEINFFFEDDPYTGFEDIIRDKMNPKEIWQHYWIKQRQNCLDFINHLSFDYLIRLIGDESLFEVFVNDTEIQDMIVESLKYENYKTYIKTLRRFKVGNRIIIYVLSVIKKLFNSVIKQKIFDSLAKEDFIFIEELLVRYFSSDITSGLDIINQIKQYKPEIESSFILRYERDENLYGFSNRLTREIIRRSNSAETIIADLEFARENLQDLFKHIISKTDYSIVKSYIWDSSSSSDFQEVIWYLGTLDLWKINAVNLARELVKNTYFRDYELPFIVKHTPNAINDRIKTEIRKELEKYDKYKNEKDHFRIKMENILFSWVKNNL